MFQFLRSTILYSSIVLFLFSSSNAFAQSWEAVRWKNNVNTVADYSTGKVGSTLSRTKLNRKIWNSDAVSTKTINGNGAVRWQFSTKESPLIVGLQGQNSSQSLTDADFAIFAPGYGKGMGKAVVYESGKGLKDGGLFNYGDTFEIRRIGSKVHYLKNGAIFYTSKKTSSGPLMVDAALHSDYGKITHALLDLGLPTDKTPKLLSEKDSAILTGNIFAKVTLESLAADEASVSWNLNQGAQGFVAFCKAPCDPKSTGATGTIVERGFLDFHRQLLGLSPKLEANKLYNFSLAAIDRSGTKSLSPVFQFKTKTAGSQPKVTTTTVTTTTITTTTTTSTITTTTRPNNGTARPWDPPKTNGPIVSLASFAQANKVGQTENILRALKAAAGGRLVIPAGKWMIQIRQYGTLIPAANTTIELKEGAILQVEPSPLYKTTALIRINDTNVHVRGRGTIVGDLRTHLGKVGENVFLIWASSKAKNWSIIGPTLRESWGDGIAVTSVAGGTPPVGGLIDHVVCDDNRRQGISIISSHGLRIGDNVVLKNTGQLAKKIGLVRQRPTAGLDVEPEHWGSVMDLKVGGVIADNNRGGGFVVQNPWKANTTHVTFTNSIATRNGQSSTGIAQTRLPHSGFEIKEGGFAKLINVTANNNRGPGVSVSGALGGRTLQGRIEVYGGTSNNNNSYGWLLQNNANGGRNILKGIKGTGNPLGLYKVKGGSGNVIEPGQ